MELKNAEFFESINWDKTAKKEIKPPIDVSEFLIDYKEDKEAKEEEKNGDAEAKFSDKDYTEWDANENRFANITFAASDNNV